MRRLHLLTSIVICEKNTLRVSVRFEKKTGEKRYERLVWQLKLHVGIKFENKNTHASVEYNCLN